MSHLAEPLTTKRSVKAKSRINPTTRVKPVELRDCSKSTLLMAMMLEG